MDNPNPPLADGEAAIDPELQRQFESIDTLLRTRHGLRPEQAAAGVLDFKRSRSAMVRGGELYYAASVPKIGILLAYFHLNPGAAADLPSEIRRDLGLMIKASSNEAASRFSRSLGLTNIQQVLSSHGFYDVCQGGGLWMGKHYGEDGARVVDPVGGHSHAATVRQLVRFYALLEQGKLLSPEVCRVMREIFESPDIPQDQIKFVSGLSGRSVQVIRKWGSWEDWLHDTAVITGPGRHYVLIGLTHHPRGDEYLAELARAVDDLLLQ